MREHGAMFFDELAADARLLPAELEAALGELVACGLATADSFAGLRALLRPAAKRGDHARRRRRGVTLDQAGRWALVRRGATPAADPAGRARSRFDQETIEYVVRVLLRRYGVVSWRLLEREASWMPAWRELLPELHRLEARGEIRGGRFVAGLAGEQFALPEAIPLLRDVRRRLHDGTVVGICGSDPLNLCGTLLPGEKVPALASNRIAFEDGVPVAARIAGQVEFWLEPEPEARERWLAALRDPRWI
jgi:ATP-dependent helicase Lhr and Lhr-like helicase